MEPGNDHFLLTQNIEVTTVALAIIMIRVWEQREQAHAPDSPPIIRAN